MKQVAQPVKGSSIFRGHSGWKLWGRLRSSQLFLNSVFTRSVRFIGSWGEENDVTWVNQQAIYSWPCFLPVTALWKQPGTSGSGRLLRAPGERGASRHPRPLGMELRRPRALAGLMLGCRESVHTWLQVFSCIGGWKRTFGVVRWESVPKEGAANGTELWKQRCGGCKGEVDFSPIFPSCIWFSDDNGLVHHNFKTAPKPPA